MSFLAVSSIAVGLRLAITITAVASYAVLARALGQHGSGQYFLFVAIVLALSTIAELGLSQSATVFSGRQAADALSIHKALAAWAAVAGIVTGIAALWLLPLLQKWLPDFRLEWAWLTAIALPLAIYASLWQGLAIGLGRIVAANLVQFGAALLSLVLSFIFVLWNNGGVRAAVTIYVVVLVGQAATMAALVFSFAPDRLLRSSERLYSDMLRFGVRGYAGSVSTLVWARSTLFVLETFHGASAVGIFAVAQQLAEKMLLPSQVIRDVIYQRISSADRQDAVNTMNRYLRLTICGLVPVLLAGGWAAPYVCAWIFGPQFAASAGVFRVLLLGSLVMVVSTVLVPFFLGQLARPGLLSMLAWLNGALNVGLAFAFIPRWGVTGAAVAMLCTQIVGTVIVFLLYLRLAPTRLARATKAKRADLAAVLAEVGAFTRTKGAWR